MPYNQIISIFFLKTESFNIFVLFGRGALSGQFENKNIQLVKLDIYKDKQTRNKETADQKNRRQDKHTYIKIDAQKNRQIDKRQLER